MGRGNFALIDAIGALVIVLILYSIVGSFIAGDGNAILKKGIEREEVRSEFYGVLFSGGLQGLAKEGGLGAPLQIGGLQIGTSMPTDRPFVNFFATCDGGVRVFYICKRE
ncbi:MAG: hypothetical protein FJZ49_03310 [Candidatus Verstraetearchaeota archaeon]|nr:hypothetical protein [Candidatus Verstraetearchaeota archaeon]